MWTARGAGAPRLKAGSRGSCGEGGGGHASCPQQSPLTLAEQGFGAACSIHGRAMVAPFRHRPIHQGSSIMTRSDLVNALAERFSPSSLTVTRVRGQDLARGHGRCQPKVTASRSGDSAALSVTRRPPRTGRNPRSAPWCRCLKRVPHFNGRQSLARRCLPGTGDAPAVPADGRNRRRRPLCR